MSDTVTGFPQLATWLSDFCASREDSFIKELPSTLSDFFASDAKIPSRYGWRFRDADALERQIRTAKTPQSMNQIYWFDHARSVEAYAVVTVWRVTELLKPTIRSLNLRELVPPAVLARSILELSTAFVVNANVIRRTFTQVDFPADTVVVSQEFEDQIIRMMWGRRLADPPPHLKQTNAQTALEHIAEQPGRSELLRIYEYLCELAHPNFIGNVRFWSHVERTDADGSELRVLARSADQEPAVEILEKILWALRWSAECAHNAFHITRQSLSELFHKLGLHSPEDYPD
jgi:hypothetical protein